MIYYREFEYFNACFISTEMKQKVYIRVFNIIINKSLGTVGRLLLQGHSRQPK